MTRFEFSKADVESLLVQCHRRCCICHRYCGVKIEVDHIEGADTPEKASIENGIALCFDCHAEVKHYNPQHPKGRKFHPGELRAHRNQWLKLCAERPEMFVQGQPPPEAGSLERVLSELEFNRILAGAQRGNTPFEMTQFRRAVADGTFIWLAEPMKSDVLSAYATMAMASNAAAGLWPNLGNPIENAIKSLQGAL